MSYAGSAAVAGQGTQLQRGDGASPENFTTTAENIKISMTGSKADSVDVTNMDGETPYREILPTLLTPGDIAVDGNFIVGDAGQQNMQADFAARVKHNWRIAFPNGAGYYAFAAYVTAFDPDFPVDKHITFTAKLTITGARTLVVGS